MANSCYSFFMHLNKYSDVDTFVRDSDVNCACHMLVG